ncbi:hypothetical protein [Geminisphaera colitermitum]|uniref:hypothetical protein n=1 Tax=Geminisphaera colitermitum TaxID=1148786 RepID=UPI001E43FE66|nr:hypothetical protein [Geminisphaera colitermitum]
MPSCPYLPAPRPGMDWRAMNAHGPMRDGGFYLTALTYAHTLWQRGLAARAVLCLDRAFGAELAADAPVLHAWPLPYAAMAWLVTHTPAEVFIGNPRVHFQHYADRMNEPRKEQRRWRAWACWALVRKVRPDWPADSKHAVVEPSVEQIAAGLRDHGLPGEDGLWRRVLEYGGRVS